MRVEYLCPNGHRWEGLDGQSGVSACPTCGEAGAGNQQTIEFRPESGSVDFTLDQTIVGGEAFSAAAGSAPRPSPRNAIAPEVPGYEVLECLGRGGMGAVYRARHARLNREVALKFISMGPHPRAEDRLRFQIEAQSLASLQHPHVVQVYEVGEHLAQPYLAMELVEGPSLEGYSKQHRLKPREAAQITEKLARAVHATHLRGIVHRDLKPANVLLAAGNEPKLTDFGLAKRIETDSAITRPGMVVGTPSYMAPEQAEGESGAVGPLSDVYSLGAILYELLAGRKPFVADSVLKTLEMIRVEEPAPPSRFEKGVPRDLETICLKCLEKNRSRRYASAGELADDLQRFLRGEPVAARPLGRVERTVKWARRRPATAVSILLIVGGILAASIGGLWHNQTLRAERDATEKYFRLSQDAIEVLLTEVTADQFDSSPSTQRTRRAMLEAAHDFYRNLYAERANNPRLQSDLAKARMRLADIERHLGRYQESERSYRQAIESLQLILATDPRSELHQHHLAEAYNGLAELQRITSRNSQARENYGAAIGIAQELAARFPDQWRYRADLSRYRYSLSLSLDIDGEPEQAVANLESAIALAQQLLAADQANPRYRQDLARSHLNLGKVLRRMKKSTPVEAAYAMAQQLYESLERDYPHKAEYSFEHALVLNNLGNHLNSTAQLADALRAHEQAGDILEQLCRDYPNVIECRREWGNTLNSLGYVQALQGNHEAAAEYLRRAADVLRQLSDSYEERPELAGDLGMTLGNLGEIDERLGNHAQAELELAEAWQHLQMIRARQPENPDYAAAAEQVAKWLAVAQRQLARQEEIRDFGSQLFEQGHDSEADSKIALAYFGSLLAPSSPTESIDEALMAQCRTWAREIVQAALRKGHVQEADLAADPNLAALLQKAGD